RHRQVAAEQPRLYRKQPAQEAAPIRFWVAIHVAYIGIVRGQRPLATETIDAHASPLVAPAHSEVAQIVPAQTAGGVVANDRRRLEINRAAGLLHRKRQIGVLPHARYALVEGPELGEYVAPGKQAMIFDRSG